MKFLNFFFAFAIADLRVTGNAGLAWKYIFLISLMII